MIARQKDRIARVWLFYVIQRHLAIRVESDAIRDAKRPYLRLWCGKKIELRINILKARRAKYSLITLFEYCIYVYLFWCG